MSREDGNNLGCGGCITIIIICAILTVVLIEPKDDNVFATIILGLIIGYIVAIYVNNSDRFRDL